MKPLIHAKNSAKKYGGRPEDYFEVHNFIDSTKAVLPDIRHRALLHSAFGIFMVERVFGVYITNSDGKQVAVRDIGEDHVIEDMGFIPTVEHWLRNIKVQAWMFGRKRHKVTKHIKLED